MGRTADLARLGEFLAARTPIVTLWGPPGIGKTRLAIEACRSTRFWFCDLAAARDADDLRAVVARAIGPADPAIGGQPIEGALARLPAGVVILDNFEHLVAHGAETVGAWSAAARSVTFLVTSRERLRLEGEVTHEVAPLVEAVELFLERARALSPDALADVDRDLLAEVVARLDGIPLAVELAAARLDVVGVRGLAARIDRQLELLASAGGATLRNAIDSSFASLSPAEQRVFAQCAVFEGSFVLEAATSVIEGENVLDRMQSLRDRSLLRCLHENGAVRFSFLESIREYALEILQARADERAVRRRHARFYLSSPEVDANLAVAIAQALEDGDVVAAVAAFARIPPSRMSDRLLALLGRALRRDLPPDLRAQGHRASGRALHLRGRLTEARRELEHALSLASGELAADVMTDLGVVHHQVRELDVARSYYERALEAHHQNHVAIGRCLGNLGAIHHDRRSFDAALGLYGRALAAFRRAGEGAMEGIFLTNLAIVFHEQGAHDRARSNYEDAIERLVQVGDRRLEAIARTNLGILCHELGDLEAAHACHAAALAALRDVVDRCAEGLCCGRLAMVAAALGRREEARSACERGRRLLAGIDDPMAHGVFALFRAFVELVLDRKTDVARTRIAASEALCELSDDARAAVRLIEATLAAAPPAVLVVGPEGRWFAPPDGDPHDLGGRRLLQRLLWSLVERHREAPGDGLTLDALREAGWPGERALPEAAANRLHVALTELRRRGLRSCLVRKESRYLIDPSLRVELRAS